jgi:hypothetical protein
MLPLVVRVSEWWEATGEIAEVQRVGEERDEGELEGGKRERRSGGL